MAEPFDRGEPLVVGLGGTTRRESSTEQALRYALGVAASLGARTLLISSAELELPMYAPEKVERSPQARRLVRTLADADGLIIASPGYHGGVSGLVKNALDYVEDLRDADAPYLDGRAVGCIVCASGWQATGTTLVALRSVVHALRGWPTPMGVVINTADQVFAGGEPREDVAENLAIVAEQVVSFARRRASFGSAGHAGGAGP